MLYVKPLVVCALYAISLVLYSVTKHGESLYRQMVIANAPRLPVHIYQCTVCVYLLPRKSSIMRKVHFGPWSWNIQTCTNISYRKHTNRTLYVLPARGNLGIEICTLSHDKSHSCVFGQDTSITIYWGAIHMEMKWTSRLYIGEHKTSI